MEAPKRKPGRPPGRDYETKLSVRIGSEQAGTVRALAERWGCSLGAVLRRLIDAAARDA